MTATLTKPRPSNAKSRAANVMPAVNDSLPPHPNVDFEEEELEPAIEELRPLCVKQRSDTFEWYRRLGKIVAKHFVRVKEEREKYND